MKARKLSVALALALALALLCVPALAQSGGEYRETAQEDLDPARLESMQTFAEAYLANGMGVIYQMGALTNDEEDLYYVVITPPRSINNR